MTEVELSEASGDVDLPWIQLSGAEDARDVLAGDGSAAPGRAGPGLWRQTQHRARRFQREALVVLELLSCNVMTYFFEHLSPRNVVFLFLSASVFISAWLTLEPSSPAWAFGVFYLCVASTRLGSLEPVYSVALGLVASVVFEVSSDECRGNLWKVLGALAMLSEVCWWPSANFLIESDFHAWLCHFSTFYLIVIDAWFWPKILEVDPTQWGVFREIEVATPSTQQAVVDVGASLALVAVVPLAACALVAAVVVCRQSPRLFLALCAVYALLAAALLAMAEDLTPERAASIGQAPIALILLLLGREQLAMFGDHRTWRGQALLLLLFASSRLAALHWLPAPGSASAAQAAAVLGFLLGCKLWLSAQCSAAHLQLDSAASSQAWLPRSTGWILAGEAVYESSLTVAR